MRPSSSTYDPFRFILASGSPRRKEFISYLNIPYEVIVADIDENSDFIKPQDFVVDVARKKEVAVYDRICTRTGFGTDFFPVICAADTIVVLEDKIYGKPASDQEAKEILKKLAGKTHLVMTGVALSYFSQVTKKKKQRHFMVETKVTFNQINDNDLELYISTKDPLDKAGAYGIQGPALVFIKGLEGSYSNVVGLPLAETMSELQILMKEDLQGAPERDWRTFFYD